MITEEQLEDLCQAWFEELGYQVINGPDIAPDSSDPERSDFREVILKLRLEAAIEERNKEIKDTHKIY